MRSSVVRAIDSARPVGASTRRSGERGDGIASARRGRATRRPRASSATNEGERGWGDAVASEEEDIAWRRVVGAVRRRIEGADEDVYANALLAADAGDSRETLEATTSGVTAHAMDVLAFRRLSAMMNAFEKGTETHGIARQVVVITAGADTRAFRLPFPSGTAIFECADAGVHEKMAAIMKSVKAKPSRGCSHRRVPVDVTGKNVSYGDMEERLERAGYRPDVRSVWLVQDLHGWDHARLASFMAESADLMTTGSEIIIDATPLGSSDDILRREFATNGVMPEVVRIPADDDREAIRLILGRAQRVSLKESEYYFEQLKAAEDEADEDGFED